MLYLGLMLLGDAVLVVWRGVVRRWTPSALPLPFPSGGLPRGKHHVGRAMPKQATGFGSLTVKSCCCVQRYG